MTTAIDWRQLFQSGAFTRQQCEILRNLLQNYSESVDAAAAPSDAQYLTLAVNTTLTAERTFVAGTALTGVDLGAGSTYTVNLDDTAVTPGSYGSASSVATLTVDQQGRLTAAGVTAISITSAAVTDFTEAAQDAIGSAISAGTGDGASLSYSDGGNSISVTNTDKGSTAVATHEAALDPHPQYLTPAEGAAAYQPLGATLTALAGASWAANALPIGTGADTLAQTSFAANTFPARASTGNLVAKSITDFGLSLVDDADASAARTTLGLGTAALVADSGLVHIAGTETVTGAKTFSAAATFGATGSAATLNLKRASDGVTSAQILLSTNELHIKNGVTNAPVRIYGNNGAADVLVGEFTPGLSALTGALYCTGSFTAGDSYSDSHTVNGLLLSGDASSVGGSIIIAGQYSGTQTTANFGGMASSGGAMLGYCVRPNNSSATGFLSTVNLTLARTAVILDGDGFGVWHTSSSAASAGAAAALTNKMQVGNLVASLSVEYLTLGVGASTYGANLRHKDDSGTTRWLTGILGGSGARDWVLYDIVNASAPIQVSYLTNAMTLTGAVSVVGAVSATTTITAAKSLLVSDVYALTAVSTAAQTRTLDLANGAVQTITANQAFTLAGAGPSGSAGEIELWIYNSLGSNIAITVSSTGIQNDTATTGFIVEASATRMVKARWTGSVMWITEFSSGALVDSGDLRPT